MELGKIDLNMLNIFQRIILATNCTLTRVLEAAFLDKIYLEKINEKVMTWQGEYKALELKGGEQVLEREVLLRGKKDINYLYAKSFIVLERLNEEFRNELLNTKTSIGHIWTKHKTELYKVFTNFSIESAGELYKFFDIEPDDIIFKRTYVVYNEGKPIDIIMENFPNIHLNKLMEQYLQAPSIYLTKDPEQIDIYLRLYKEQLRSTYFTSNNPRENLLLDQFTTAIDHFQKKNWHKSIDILLSLKGRFKKDIHNINVLTLLGHCLRKANQEEALAIFDFIQKPQIESLTLNE